MDCPGVEQDPVEAVPCADPDLDSDTLLPAEGAVSAAEEEAGEEAATTEGEVPTAAFEGAAEAPD